jgi:thiamine biosynthesis lipoprotein
VRDADTHWSITFTAMAGPCEILVRCGTASEARELASLAYVETRRIEHKFSRYRNDSVVSTINRSNGERVAVDEETLRLLRYAGHCYELSEGRFDITSGVLRQAWTFDGRTVSPDEKKIASLRAHVGWSRVQLDGAAVRLWPGMEIDLGGIGKEYAADRVADLVTTTAGYAVLVNFGGDIRAVAGAKDPRPWTIGIETPGRAGSAVGQIEIAEGGVATSGDSRRYCIVSGRRLGHILDPRTGWPVSDAPQSVTVIADNCTAAGFLATMAMLHGPGAETFLDAQEVKYHCIRPSGHA